MDRLEHMSCVNCEAGEPRLTETEVAWYQPQVPGWTIVMQNNCQSLERVFRFVNFREALAFTNRIGWWAEDAGHYPALLTEWGHVTVTWWTPKVKGLHRNDFIMAARTDKVYQELVGPVGMVVATSSWGGKQKNRSLRGS